MIPLQPHRVTENYVENNLHFDVKKSLVSSHCSLKIQFSAEMCRYVCAQAHHIVSSISPDELSRDGFKH